MISRHAAAKLAKEAKVRISSDALSYFIEVLTDIAEAIARESVDLSVFAERRTVMEKDVEFAIRKMFRGLI